MREGGKGEGGGAGRRERTTGVEAFLERGEAREEKLESVYALWMLGKSLDGDEKDGGEGEGEGAGLVDAFPSSLPPESFPAPRSRQAGPT